MKNEDQQIIDLKNMLDFSEDELIKMLEQFIESKKIKPQTQPFFKEIDVVVQLTSGIKLHVMGDSSIIELSSTEELNETLQSLGNPARLDITENGNIYIADFKVNGYNVVLYKDGTFMITTNDYAIGETTLSNGSDSAYTSVYSVL